MRFYLHITLPLLFVHINTAYAGITGSFSTLPRGREYDFVIAGGGNAGVVLAHRLTENPRWKVLVIEAGPTHEDVFNSRVPGLVGSLQGTPYDWNYTTVPLPELNNRVLALARGHILGGSNSINGMFYTRGSSSDYDRWARVTGDSGWSWKEILPYIYKTEKWTSPSDGHDDRGEYDPKYHSTTGLVSVSITGATQAIDAKVIQASKELGGEFQYNVDMNSGNLLGLGWTQLTVGNGERSSAAASYLAPKYANRKNLDVLVGHRVVKIVESGRSRGNAPVLTTVRFVQEAKPNAQAFEVTASKEVLVCGGVFGTPQILHLSGLGDSAELKAKGIKPVVNLPDVGKNLTDQPMMFLTYALGISETREPTRELQQSWLDQWVKEKRGPLTGPGNNHLAWMRIPEDSPIWEEYEDPASGRNTPHIELSFAGHGMHPIPAPTLNGLIIPLQPISRGSVTLKSDNIFDDPLIDIGFLKSSFDLFTFKQGIANLRRFYEAKAWSSWNLTLTTPVPDNDAELEEFIRNTIISAAHAGGTAAMSPRDAQWGVVDPDLRVKKVKGLRVVDASIMPFVPAGHTQAPVYAIAERAADLIKRTWSGK
ncbi:pyranose dehydrogenase [Coprinopsis marcescibilis]|uniref:pyranose dehydrogenase (acceptor) n=1 Tax=Coprinopsis marcescibilis TaxID=230819 RepID=A0A5C3KQR9_COPMA|nr:pyranose dehydrogenase [Coprinopsis marcescibilis]